MRARSNTTQSGFEQTARCQSFRRSSTYDAIPAIDIDALHEGHYPDLDDDPHDADGYGALLRELREALSNWHEQQLVIQDAVADMLSKGMSLQHVRLRALYAAQDSTLVRLSPEAMGLMIEVGSKEGFHIGGGVVLFWQPCPGLPLGGGFSVRQVQDLSSS